jgi:hypothetical protein
MLFITTVKDNKYFVVCWSYSQVFFHGGLLYLILHIINAIKEYRLLGFFSMYRVSQVICVVDVHAYVST